MTERSGTGCLWPSPDPIFINNEDAGTDGTPISLTDDRGLDGVETLNDDISDSPNLSRRDLLGSVSSDVIQL